MNAKIVIVVGFLVAVAAIVFFTLRATPEAPPPVAAPAPEAVATTVTMTYSTEKRDWIEAAAKEFTAANPDVKLVLDPSGSIESAEAILSGAKKPTLWSPADSLVLTMFEADWQTQNHADPFVRGDDAPQALLITPLVFAIWKDRADVLLAKSGTNISWKVIHDAVVSPKGWLAVGGKADWGFVKLGHTDPTRSNSGLQALFSMTMEHFGRTQGLAVGDVLDEKYQGWVKEIEAGVGHFEASTGTFMTEMVRFGPSKYDIAVVYESLAASQIENAQGRWGDLKVYYPSTTIWSDHPIALLASASEPEKAAARRWVAFLRGRPMQERALSYGFRPADPSVPLKTADASNPFNRLAAFGVQLDIPPAASPPDAAVVRNLQTMWSRLVGNQHPR
jgi:ABC-type molybdate transport system substrate-binding protein